MATQKQDERVRRVENAAYKLICDNGFKATSMLAIAREARTSNQTLYRWYGDKIGLFNALVLRNGTSVRNHLNQALNTDIPALYALGDVAPVFLEMLLGPRAIALNQAAASDPTGALGKALARQGRQEIAPLFQALIEKAQAEGTLRHAPIDHILSTYFSLLIGDLQIRRVTGAMPPLSPNDISKRAGQAHLDFVTLFAP